LGDIIVNTSDFPYALDQLGIYVLVPVPNLLDGKIDWTDSSSLD
jgi:hypothetical protein